MIALNSARWPSSFLQATYEGGTFVCKLFHSDQFKEFQTTMKKQFKRVEVMKPESTRKISKEIFLIGLDRI